MEKIYLIRHGESEWNIKGKVQGQKDIALTSKGARQANLIGDKLKNENISSIYSSSLARAMDTALIIGEKINLKVNPMEELKEINFGIWEGMLSNEINERHYEDFVSWRNNPENFKIEKGESLRELQKRTMKGVDKIIRNNLDKNIAIVSHSSTLKIIILSLLNMDLCYFKNLTLANGSLSIIEFRDYNRVLQSLNFVEHLKEVK